MLCDPVELSQSSFGKAPERLNAVDMRIAPGKLIVAVVNAVMFIKANIDQAIVAAPAIRVNHTGNVYFSSDDGLQDGFRSIGNNLSVDIIAAL